VVVFLVAGRLNEPGECRNRSCSWSLVKRKSVPVQTVALPQCGCGVTVTVTRAVVPQG
jgi:hypothetical protein